MLSLSSHLPEIEVAAGETLVEEGGSSGSVWVLVSGSLQVRKGDVPVNVITRPGAIVGEVSVLLGTRSAATVVATEPCRLRHAADGKALSAGGSRGHQVAGPRARRAPQLRHHRTWPT